MVNRPVVILGGVVLAFVVFVGTQAGRQAAKRGGGGTRDTTVADSPGVVTLTTQEGDLVTVRRSNLPPPPPKDYRAIAQAIADGRGVTYIDNILRARGNNIARWVDRRANPILVWIDKKPAVQDWWPDFPNIARDALYVWSSAGIPVRFLFTDDSATAEVRVLWKHNFGDGAAGKTYWARDVNWWIVGADMEIGLHSASGEVYDKQAVRAIVVHEVGHLIGLDHSNDPADIMSPRIETLVLSPTDLRTANLVYRLPPGPVNPPPSAPTP